MRNNFEQNKQDAANLFNTFKPVRCQALKSELVYFTSEGFNHLLFKSARTLRDKSDSENRFRFLEDAFNLIRKSTTFQEYEEILQNVKARKKGQTITESKLVKYWGFIAIIRNGKFKIKVILRQVGANHIEYWSVIPTWTTTKYGDMKFKNFSSGNLQED